MDERLRTAARELASELEGKSIAEEFNCQGKNYAVANEPHYWGNNRAYGVASVDDYSGDIFYEPFVITMGKDEEAFFNKFHGEIMHKWYITPTVASRKITKRKYRF